MNPPTSTRMPLKTPRKEKPNSSDSESSKDRVSVFCRLRPLPDENEDSCVTLISPTVLSLTCPSDNRVLRREVQYEFKHIFTMFASQKEIFDHVAYTLLQDLLKGKNALLFTYGITGSGKTYSLTGEPHNPGMMPRCIYTIFNSIEGRQTPKFVIKTDRMNGFEVQSDADAEEDRRAENRLLSKLKKKPDKLTYENDFTRIHDINESNLYAVFVSYTEIYNNTVYDLLDESGGKTLQSKILREDSNKNMYVNGAVEVEVKSAAEAFDLFNIGQRRKRMGNTVLNAESSRSHSVFNIRVVQLQQDSRNSHGERVIPAGNAIQVGQLSLVDLAGSERTVRTQTHGKHLKEAGKINNSLMTLRNCLEALRDNQTNNANRMIPYRDSRLTLLFKNFFEGEGKVHMVVCVNPAAQEYDENVQVMKFTEVAKDVKVARSEARFTPYKRAQKTAKTPMSVRSTNALVARIKTAAPLVFGPRIPKLRLDIENLEAYDAALSKLEDVLHTRKQKSAIFSKDLSAKEQRFRRRLTEMEQEFTLKCSEVKNAQAMYKKEKNRAKNLETKIMDLEKCCQSYDREKTTLQENIHRLKSNLDEKDLKLNQNLVERQRTKQKIAMHQEKHNQELDLKLRQQREHYNAACLAKDLKLQRVRAALEHDVDLTSAPADDEETTENEASTPRQPPSVPQVQSAHRGRHRIAVANRRRSRSVGEVWLEHNSVKPVALGTVMQPSMKKRKSVTQLRKAGDVTSTKQSKYCLITQEADTDGEVETKVYKGDIVPTCGGGAQVILNDVERLRQESPVGTPRK